MNANSDKFLQEITDRIKILKETTNRHDLDEFSPIIAEIGNLINNNESPSGIPPPDDQEFSYDSLSSSLSVPDVPIADQLCIIQNKNKELKRTATITLQDFKNTSRTFLSKSQLQSGKGSVILHELESVKRHLDEVYEEAKNYPSRPKSISQAQTNLLENDENINSVYKKMQDIQQEINEAAKRLMESEKMILSAEEKNHLLEGRIKKLEESVNSASITEGPEKSRNENCMCILS